MKGCWIKPREGEIKVEAKEAEARPDDTFGRGSQFILKLPLTKYNMKMKKVKSSLTKDELQKQLNKKSSALDRLKKKTRISEEAQAREVQIQLALERVRARTMAA